jgi:hypothetical protein
MFLYTSRRSEIATLGLRMALVATKTKKRNQFNLNLPPAELARLKRLSAERRVPMVNIIRFALDRLFEQLEGG